MRLERDAEVDGGASWRRTFAFPVPRDAIPRVLHLKVSPPGGEGRCKAERDDGKE